MCNLGVGFLAGPCGGPAVGNQFSHRLGKGGVFAQTLWYNFYLRGDTLVVLGQRSTSHPFFEVLWLYSTPSTRDS